jgi:hypothetical protein
VLANPALTGRPGTGIEQRKEAHAAFESNLFFQRLNVAGLASLPSPKHLKKFAYNLL